MPYVVACVVMLTLMCLANLALLAVLARRLRALRRELRLRAAPPGSAVSDGVVRPGTVVPAFISTDTDGRPVSRDALTGDTLVYLLAPGCPPCEQILPNLVDRAWSHPGGRDRVLAVVVRGPAGAAERYVGSLAGVARVFIEAAGETHSLLTSFDAKAFPAVYLIDAHGTVLASGSGSLALTALPALSATHAPA
jgi:hypothetical protein